MPADPAPDGSQYKLGIYEVGGSGAQVRTTIALDSNPVDLLQVGSICQVVEIEGDLIISVNILQYHCTFKISIYIYINIVSY